VTSEQIDKEDVAVRAVEAYLDIAMARYETGLGPIPECHHRTEYLIIQSAKLGNPAGQRDGGGGQLIQALGGGWDVKELPSLR
jgi:hypothetical protein